MRKDIKMETPYAAMRRENKALNEMLIGSRRGREREAAMLVEVGTALWRYENLWFFRLGRWVLRRRAQSVIIKERFDAMVEAEQK
jgi:hypothetical protein